jgi:hypothetical protein
MIVAIIKSMMSSTVTSIMIAICMVRIGMMVYPNYPTVKDVPQFHSGSRSPVAKSETVNKKAKPRIVLGNNSIKNLGGSD